MPGEDQSDRSTDIDFSRFLREQRQLPQKHLHILGLRRSHDPSFERRKCILVGNVGGRLSHRLQLRLKRQRIEPGLHARLAPFCLERPDAVPDEQSRAKIGRFGQSSFDGESQGLGIDLRPVKRQSSSAADCNMALIIAKLLIRHAVYGQHADGADVVGVTGCYSAQPSS